MKFSGTWLNLEPIELREITQTQKGKRHMLSLMYGFNSETFDLNIWPEVTKEGRKVKRDYRRKEI